ncbi:MAG: hypothetical protein C4348_02355 [Patescibacteria group bacterium]
MIKKKPVIYSSPESYCAYIELPSSKYYCISNLTIGTETTIPPNQKGYCDGITFLKFLFQREKGVTLQMMDQFK